MWDMIVSVPDHCLSFYLVYLVTMTKFFISVKKPHKLISDFCK